MQSDYSQIPVDVAMNILKFTNVKFGKVRVFMNGKIPWFVAADICRALEIKNPRDALTRLDEDEKGVVLTDTLGGKQNVNIINEFGLYTLVLSSRKKSAKKFKRWITHDVIPSIRNYGIYLDLQHPEVRKMTYEVHNAFQTAISVFDRLCMEPNHFYDSSRGLTKEIQKMVDIEVGGKDRASAEQLIKLVILESAFTNKLLEYIYSFKKGGSQRKYTDILNSCMTDARNALARRGFDFETIYVEIAA